MTGPRPRAFGHRGARGTHPENTLPAFEAGRDAGVEAFELDVHATADGEIVVLHDPTLDRTTDAEGPVAERTLAELAGIDAGYRFTPDGGVTFPYRGRGIGIPTLAQVLTAFPDMPVIVEIKQIDPPIEARLEEVLDATGATDRALVFSLEQAPLDRWRERSGDGTTGFGPEDVADFLRRLGDDDWDGYGPPGVAFAVPVRWRGVQIVSPPFVEAAHRFDREIYVWTVNEADAMERLLDIGVDGLISDFPARLVDVVGARRAEAPRGSG